MAGIDVDIIQSNVLNKRTIVQKLSSLLLTKVTENEKLIKVPLEKLLVNFQQMELVLSLLDYKIF
jgi:hypothetical protein